MSADPRHAPLEAGLGALTASAAAALEAELGAETACTLHRDGRVTGGMKYHEGRLVAFRETERAVRNAGDRSAVEEIRDRWRAEFARRRDATRPSPPWVAYATGGLEAATEALRLFDDRR